MEVLLCKEDQRTVVIEVSNSLNQWVAGLLCVLQPGTWGIYVPTKEGANMKFYACPAGYCSCRHDAEISNDTCVYSYVSGDPDLQCSCGRTGKDEI